MARFPYFAKIAKLLQRKNLPTLQAETGSRRVVENKSIESDPIGFGILIDSE
jgi:hypothetical protein